MCSSLVYEPSTCDFLQLKFNMPRILLEFLIGGGEYCSAGQSGVNMEGTTKVQTQLTQRLLDGSQREEKRQTSKN